MLISKSPPAKDSIENWYKHISKTKSPRKLTRILLSDRPFKDKANLLVALPVSATEQNTDMRWLESKFEDTGHAQLAQIVRWRLFWYLSEDQRKRILKWSHKSVVADIQRRWIVQRKVYIQEEFRALHKAQALSDSENDDVAMKRSHTTYNKELR